MVCRKLDCNNTTESVNKYMLRKPSAKAGTSADGRYVNRQANAKHTATFSKNVAIKRKSYNYYNVIIIINIHIF